MAILAGLGQAASIASPWNGQPQWWLQLFSLALLAALLQRSRSWKQGAMLGWAFGIAWLTGTWWWLFISLHIYGGLAATLAVLAVLLLAAFLASYCALAGALTAAARGSACWLHTLVFACAWMLAELLRETWFTGFPWGAGGYAHVDGPLAVLAPQVGVWGIGFVAALLAFGIASLGSSIRSLRHWLVVAGALGLLAAGNMAANRTTVASSATKLSVALLQGNIPQDEKFEGGTGIPVALEWYGQQLNASRASLTVTPETAIPLLPNQLPDGYYDAMKQRFTGRAQAALVGIPLGSFADGYSNSVQGFAPGQPTYRFDKHHLVPFGEFIPPLFKWFVRLMNIPLGDFNRGPLPQPPFAWAGQRLALNICYEDLFGEELGANFADAAKAPTIFVNVSNIGWFGNTIAIDQHLQISRMRAIEFDRPVIRATNTGATVIIDHTGRVTHSLPRHTRGVLLGEVEGRETITAYAWWVSRFGLWPLWWVALVVPAFALWRGRQRAHP